MRTFCLTFALSYKWRQTKYVELLIVTASKPWPSSNMLLNMIICRNRWPNFSVSFRVVALKLIKLICFALSNHWFSSISYASSLAKWRHSKLSFSLHWASIYLSLVKIPWFSILYYLYVRYVKTEVLWPLCRAVVCVRVTPKINN